MSGFEDRLKAGWAEEQQLLRRIKADQKRLREIRQDRNRLLIDLCTDRPLLDRVNEDNLPTLPSLPAPVKGLSAEEIREDFADIVGDTDLADTFADLFARIADQFLREHYLSVLTHADHPEEWVDGIRAVVKRRHLVVPDDWTSEYARAYLDEVSQRANDLFREIDIWREVTTFCHEEFGDPIDSWDQWIECTVDIGPCDVEVLYRYGDLTSKADGGETVECDFRFAIPGSGVVTTTRVIGPASRSVGGESIRDQLRVLAQAVYEDAVREAREASKPAKRTGGKKKGATT